MNDWWCEMILIVKISIQFFFGVNVLSENKLHTISIEDESECTENEFIFVQKEK